MGTIVIHAGMPKAGSSSIQDWLRRNGTELLDRHDIQLVNTVLDESDRRLDVVPRTRDFRADELGGLYLERPDMRQEILSGLAEGLSHQADRHRTVVLSGEAIAHPFWRLEEPFLRCLEEVASAHRVRVAYYVRPQHEALESAWRQWGFRSGLSPSNYLEHRATFLWYFETFTEVRPRAPSVLFEPRPFRSDLLTEGSVTTDFARRFLELDGDDWQADLTWSNRGLPLELANLLQAAPAGLFWADPHDNARLNKIKRLAGELESPESGETVLSRQVLQAYCHGAYEAGNQRLAAALGWDAGEFVPAPDCEAAGSSADLRRLDELWRPRASEAELQLLWRSLATALAASPNGSLASPKQS